jgi:hyperosmotically inducible periplasmic protein
VYAKCWKIGAVVMGAMVVITSVAAGQEGVTVGTTHDRWIAGEIEGAFRVDERLDIFDLEIHVSDGWVTLSGEIASELDRRAAVDIATRVEGVKGVRDELIVTRADATGRREPAADAVP